MSESFCDTMRPTMSVELPGVNEMMTCTGLFGYPWPNACVASAALAAISNLIHAFMLPPLLWFRTGIAHHLAEHLVFLADESVELWRSHGHRLAAKLGQAVVHLGRLQCAIDLRVEPGHDVARCSCRREEAHPEIEFTAGETRLGDGRDLRQRGDAGRRTDGKRNQFAVLERSHARHARHPGEVHAPAHRLGEDGRRALQRHVHRLDTGRDVEFLRIDMRRAADARGGVIELARLRFGGGYEFFY